MERDDLHWAPQSQRKVTLLTDVCVQCSYPRLEKQHLVSVASICYKAAQKSARTSHSSLQKSVRKTTQHLGHMLRLKGLLRPGGWKCCVQTVLTFPNLQWDAQGLRWSYDFYSLAATYFKVLLHHSSSYIIKNYVLKLRHCYLRQLLTLGCSLCSVLCYLQQYYVICNPNATKLLLHSLFKSKSSSKSPNAVQFHSMLWAANTGKH